MTCFGRVASALSHVVLVKQMADESRAERRVDAVARKVERHDLRLLRLERPNLA